MVNLSLIGFFSAIPTSAATKSLTFSALNGTWWYLPAHVGPGLFNVASLLIEATEISWARLCAFGGTGDVYKLVELNSPDGLRYVGLKSYTDCPVANAVGASIVREHDSVWKEEMQRDEEREKQKESKAAEEGGSSQQHRGILGKSGGRKMKVIVLEIKKKWPVSEENHVRSETEENPAAHSMRSTGRPETEDIEAQLIDTSGRPEIEVIQATHSMDTTGRPGTAEIQPTQSIDTTGRPETEEIRVHLTDTTVIAMVAGWLPLLLTVGVITICGCFKEWLVFVLILVGTLGMIVAVCGLKSCFVFKYSIPNPAKGAPAGDCVVIDETDPNVFHIIEGEEKNIQALFQMKIIYESNRVKFVVLTAGVLLALYVICSVLSMPNASSRGQALFVSANVIGLVADMFKASRKVKLGLARKAREQFQIEFKGSLRFSNRTAAVAFVAKHANDCGMLQHKKLLPCDGPVWSEWWNELKAALDASPFGPSHSQANQEQEGLNASLRDIPGLSHSAARRPFVNERDETLLQQLREYMRVGINASLPSDNPGQSTPKPTAETANGKRPLEIYD